MSPSNLLSQIAGHPEDVAATYSASKVESVVIACFFGLHAIAPDPRLNTLPDVLLLSSKDLAQSLSVNPYNLKSKT